MANSTENPCWKGRSSTQMDVYRRPSHCPVWRNRSHAGTRISTDGSSETLPQNPFCRLINFENDAADVQCVGEYQSYQLSCYVQASAMTPPDNDDKSASTAASHQEGKSPSHLWLRRTLQPASSLLSSAKGTLRTVATTTARILDEARVDISTWWLASRRVRLWLGRLMIALVTISTSKLLAFHVLGRNRPVYVLVHVCQSWSVVASSVSEPLARIESGHI
ncbi:hypothetical protein BDP55DRAFT_628346 [Colletotrichum godetiae]|uniref:Uncharacterized protein n=1 Tax=Colletotrichum godetiae TaxID=1209918 RepID=A0AAJ0AU12_9PEZI|nr:uncharacterized protein BDP55DRAFT_628346 [Colletotrichum godetiae]KAK1689798.1 hypothetical protein BDP55DRAFT_628346 [Colletotrichum godetiae]